MKRLLSILLAVVLIAMAIPATVSAAGERGYTVTVHTGGVPRAGTNGTVRFTFNGTNGTTGKLELDSPGGYDDFEANATDTYTVYGKDVGTVTSITVEEDDGWYLGWFKFNNVTYNANMWMERDETFTISNTDTYLRNYHMTVYTESIDDAGTDANVYVEIFGSAGSTGKINLENSGNDFWAGRADEYNIIGKDVGTVDRLVFSMTSNIDNWCLGWIKFNNQMYLYCDWVSEKHGPATIYIGQSYMAKTYTVKTRTSDEPEADTDGDVYIKLTGTNGDTRWREFAPPGYDPFERGQIDTQSFLWKDIGRITDITLYYSQTMGSWKPEWVDVNGVKYMVNLKLYEMGDGGDKSLNIHIESNGGYSVNFADVDWGRDISRNLLSTASTFSSPDIWFIVSGGVLMLAVAAFAVIFVQRRKKKAMVASSDSAEDNSN